MKVSFFRRYVAYLEKESPNPSVIENVMANAEMHHQGNERQ